MNHSYARDMNITFLWYEYDIFHFSYVTHKTAWIIHITHICDKARCGNRFHPRFMESGNFSIYYSHVCQFMYFGYFANWNRHFCFKGQNISWFARLDRRGHSVKRARHCNTHTLQCMTWLIYMRNMTHSCTWHDSFICVTWLIYTCDMTHLYVRHDSYICVTWPIHVCVERARHCNTHTSQRRNYTATHIRLQHTATHCNTLQHTATHCNTHTSQRRNYTATHIRLQHTATHCNTLQHTARYCNTLQHTYVTAQQLHCNTHKTATHCNTLQLTVTHIRHSTETTLQHT